ncbi:XdhC family protein [Primorskyibacter sp. 2E233]|uniref:XdhC family protein n=1 Tax=Primorskyibacter sp. 2E233 TaxID=3413431 RepID=UPI003BEFB53F
MSMIMTPQSRTDDSITLETARRRALGLPFAMATVVRTMAATSAKPGAKALIDETGEIVLGFLGGGCVRGAVGRAAREAIADGAPQLLSIRPEELLQAEGLAPGETRDGIHYARNGCPSKGALDIFIEPVLPRPRLVICGTGPVAQALAILSERFDFDRTLCLPAPQHGELPAVEHIVEHLDEDPVWHGSPYVIIATQGRGDEAALRRALGSNACHIAFVGSRKKFAALAARLSADIPSKDLARVQAPAGLDIHAITPDEIALSILADLTKRRRASQRNG